MSHIANTNKMQVWRNGLQFLSKYEQHTSTTKTNFTYFNTLDNYNAVQKMKALFHSKSTNYNYQRI